MGIGGTSIIDTARALCPPGHDFLEVATPGEAKILIPIANQQVRHSGSRLYPAFRWKERVYRAALSTWITFKGKRLTQRIIPGPHRIIPGRTGDWSLGDLLLPGFPTLFTAAVYVGIPGPTQKITIQLMDDRGCVLGFAKYADKPRTQALIANEARMLEVIPENVGPRLIHCTPFLEGELSVQTPLPGRARKPSSRLDAAQMRLVERLIQPEEAYVISKHPFIESLYARAGGRTGILEGIIANLDDSEWPVAWMHGDLSPWNMHWWRGDYLAFDWEYGREAGFAYLDAAHTLIQFAGLIQHTDPRQAKRTISNRLRAFLPAQLGKYAPAIAGLSALNMLVSWFPPREPDAYERWLGTFVEAPL